GCAWRAHEVGPRSPRPDLELLLGCGAEGVGCANEDAATVLGQFACELPDRRRLSRAVDADDEDHAGLPVEREDRWLTEQRLDLLDERTLEIAGHTTRFESPDELGSGGP